MAYNIHILTKCIVYQYIIFVKLFTKPLIFLKIMERRADRDNFFFLKN